MLADVKIEAPEMADRLVLPRLPASLLASAMVHALALVLAVRFLGSLAMPRELPRAEIIPVSLVSLPGGGGGAKGDGRPAPPPPPAPAATPAPAARPLAPPEAIKRVVAKPVPPAKVAARPAAEPAASPIVAGPQGPVAGAPGARGGGDGAAGSGAGDGSGGDGSGGARPAYGSNPRPPYPLAARRLGIEGRVLLEVVVRPDGRAASVTIRQSSGHGMLDSSAADTVRTRWRFIPARRGGAPVESTVTVPIRFRIHEG